MTDWLSIDVLLASLIVSSTASVGLIATLGCHVEHVIRFIRFAINFVATGPLLFVLAYEPFVAFTIQSLIVALGIAAYRKRIPRAASRSRVFCSQCSSSRSRSSSPSDCRS